MDAVIRMKFDLEASRENWQYKNSRPLFQQLQPEPA